MRNARIARTQLGIESHGIFVATVFLDAHGISGEFRNFNQGEHAETWLRTVLRCAGVDTWEDLPGKYIRVEGMELGQTITKIMHILEDDIEFSVAEWA